MIRHSEDPYEEQTIAFHGPASPLALWNLADCWRVPPNLETHLQMLETRDANSQSADGLGHKCLLMICILIEFQRLKKGCLFDSACEMRTPNRKTKDPDLFTDFKCLQLSRCFLSIHLLS